MRERLDAADELYAHLGGIGVDLPKLRLCITAALIAHLGVLLYLVGILRVEHQAVEPHRRHIVNIELERFYGRHTLVGAVKHHAVFFDAALFADVKALFAAADMHHRKRDTARKIGRACIADGDLGALAVHAQAFVRIGTERKRATVAAGR